MIQRSGAINVVRIVIILQINSMCSYKTGKLSYGKTSIRNPNLINIKELNIYYISEIIYVYKTKLMKKNLYFLLFSLLIFIQLPVFGVQSHTSPINEEDHPIVQATIPLDRTQLESQLGRKLTFKERIGFSLVKMGIVKEKKHNAVTDSPAAGTTNGLAISGFIIGLVSLFIAGIPLGIVAIIFSAIALGQIPKKGQKGRGFAIAGLILGIIGIVGALIVLTV